MHFFLCICLEFSFKAHPRANYPPQPCSEAVLALHGLVQSEYKAYSHPIVWKMVLPHFQRWTAPGLFSLLCA